MLELEIRTRHFLALGCDNCKMLCGEGSSMTLSVLPTHCAYLSTLIVEEFETRYSL